MKARLGAAMLLLLALVPSGARALDRDVGCDGTGPSLPAEAEPYAVLVCSGEEQGIVPQVADKGRLWIDRATGKPVSISAVPNSLAPRGRDWARSRLGADAFRFVRFTAADIQDPKERRALLNLRDHFFKRPVGGADWSVFRLQAVAGFGGMAFDFIFYSQQGEQKHLIICMQGCTGGHFAADIVPLAEATAVMELR